MKAIILAAGRGSRLNEMTNNQPKCMIKLGGRTLLHWQVLALRKAGIEDITVVTGYRRETIEGQNLATIHNPNWATTNMVSSLLCARQIVDRPAVVSYSDIVYGADLVSKLRQSKAKLAVAFDDEWLDLWQERFANPLDDAESLRLDANDKLLDIGGKVSDISEIEGQYLGLMLFSPTAFEWIDKVLAEKDIDPEKLEMTSLLNHLIKSDFPLEGIKTSGNWCEIDTKSDLVVAERRLAEGRLKID